MSVCVCLYERVSECIFVERTKHSQRARERERERESERKRKREREREKERERKRERARELDPGCKMVFVFTVSSLL